MAYVDSNQQDPNQQQTAQGNPGANNAQAPATSSGSVANAPVQASGQGVAAQPNASKAPQFQNLGDYLTANAPQTAQMGQNVATGLQNTATQTQSAIDQAQNQFNSAVQQGSTSLDQNLLNQATSDPTKFASDPNNVNTIQSYLNSSYKGPTDFSQANGYTDLASQVQNAVQQGQNANAPGGLQTLVSSQEKAPTAGIQNLDALLLKQSPQAQQAIQTAAQPLTGLGDYFNNAATTANTAAQNAATSTGAVAGQVQNAFAPIVSNFQQGLNTQQQQAEEQRNAYNQSLASTQSQAAQIETALQSFLGLVPNNGVQDYYAPIEALKPGETPATLENTATAQQFAEDQALSQLLGSGYSAALNPQLSSQAGTYQNPNAAIPDFNQNLTNQDTSLLKFWNSLPYNPGNKPEILQSFNNLTNYLTGLDPTKGNIGNLNGTEQEQIENLGGQDWANAVAASKK